MEKHENDFMQRLQRLRLQGYGVHRLEQLKGIDEELLRIELDHFEKGIERLKAVEEELSSQSITILASMDTKVHTFYAYIKAKLRNPDEAVYAEAALRALRKYIAENHYQAMVQECFSSLRSELTRRVDTNDKPVEDIFVVYKDGRLLYHQSMKGDKGLDPDILSGMITAVQDFVKHCLQYAEGSFKRLEYGKVKMVVERGEHIYVALMHSQNEDAATLRSLKTLVRRIEDKYETQLEFWDGDMDRFKGLPKVVKKTFCLVKKDDE